MFFSNQGTQGILGKPSQQQLDSVFDTHKDDEVVRIVLEKGQVQSSEGIKSGNFGATNMTMGSMAVDTKGKGLRGL